MKNKVGTENTEWQENVNKNFVEIKGWQESADRNFVKIKDWQSKADKQFVEIKDWQDKANDRFDNIEVQLGKVSLMAIDNGQDIKWIKQNMVTKQDMKEVSDRLMGAFEKFYKSNKNTEQEQVFMGSRVKRIEMDVEKIKPLVGLT